MGREVRMVPKNWEHPKDEEGGYIPLLKGYAEDAKEFLEMIKKDGLQEAVEYMGCPDKRDYMPDWSKEEKTHLMMYEDTSEGTPISPACETPEELARWLADNGASAFGNSTASYEGWLRVAKGGFAPSAVYTPSRGIVSGVDAMTDSQP
jgi:hypothetical protein